MKKMLIGIVIILLTLTVYGRWLEPNWLHVHTVDVHIKDLDPRLEGFTILHLSDLHQKEFGPNQERLLKAIDGHKYHMVALTGDILDYPTEYDFAPTYNLLSGLTAPVYFVYGNHDYPFETKLTPELEATGVRILNNSMRLHQHNGAVVQVAGIHDPHWSKVNYRSPFYADLEQALANTDNRFFTLLLSHSPGIIEGAAQAQVPLVLVGHTHGGQIKIPLLGAPTTASGKWFDKYVQGLYTHEDTQMYINRGLGTSTLPIRFLSRPEVVFIRLVGQD